MTNEEIARFFNNARPHIQGNPNLRDPQVEGGSIKALSLIRNRFSGARAPARLPVRVRTQTG
jgi:hypothetical protein